MNRHPYIKYAYWLTGIEERRLRTDLSERGIKLKTAKGVVCTPLDPINKISSVPPEVWSATCKRPGSWYRASEKNGLYLIVSSFELPGYEDKLSAAISESSFVPPRRAGREDLVRLANAPEFVRCIPPEWNIVGETEKRIYLRWAARMGSDVTDYNHLFLTHTANHANFLYPVFFTVENGEPIPYSIDRTAHLCSCCLELFQVLGASHHRKLVLPCPGASVFARLPPDRYLLVDKGR